jgi:glycosyltransferase involved in cell wall biosynthesis
MIEIILFLILAIYIVFILQLLFGFDKVKSFEKIDKTPKTAFTIIVPFRNEAKNLPKLLRSFSKLNYPNELIEIIMVDDFSKDLSERICIQWRMQNDDINDTNIVERCTQRDNYQRVQEGYITTFSYNGHEFEEETQTKYRVGQKVPVQVNAVVDQPN